MTDQEAVSVTNRVGDVARFAWVIAILTLCGCSSVPDAQSEMIHRASEIEEYPVERKTVVEVFDLAGVQSIRSVSGVRGGVCCFFECWTLADGTKITGYDSEFVGPLPIVPSQLDTVLNAPLKEDHNLLPRKSIQSLTITSPHGKEIFHSDF